MNRYVGSSGYCEAIRYSGENLSELRDFVPEGYRDNRIGQPLGLRHGNLNIPIHVGDWVVRTTSGFAVYSDQKFQSTYPYESL